MYNLEIKEELDRIFQKLSKKNKAQMQIIRKKVREIQERPFGYKFLRTPLQGFNRVHIDKHFVLIFNIDHNHKVVTLHHYANHDEAYSWRPREA